MKSKEIKRWVISPGILEISGKTPPRGVTFCALNEKWNDLLFDVSTPAVLNYSYSVESVAMPDEQGARFANFTIFKDGDLIQRTRSFGPLHLRFSYDSPGRKMTSNLGHHMIPNELGALWPAGLHLSHIMALDMLRVKKMLFLHGASFRIDGKTICLFSPGRTGKTTVVNKMLQMGAKYIAEDVLLIDGKSAYLVPPNETIASEHLVTRNNIEISSRVDQVFICTPGTAGDTTLKRRAISDLCVFSQRIPFFSDKLVQALMMYHGLDYPSLNEQAIGIMESLVDTTDVRFFKNINEMMVSLHGC